MSTSNGSPPERVLVYAGPSVPKEDVFKRVPEAILRPPARQGDVLSDLHRHEPTHLLLIDGEFQQHFSTWIKELVYALQYPTIRGVYGASSIGALRAAELCELGMIGCGKIFEWYRSGEVTDDSEVAVAYRVDERGNYTSTVPLVNVRASKCTPEEFEAARAIHWSERWRHRLDKAWGRLYAAVDQKWRDALELLETFRDLKPLTDARPGPEHLGGLFLSQLERDRRIDVQGITVPLSRIDATVALESPDRHQIFWDADNRALALHLSDALNVLPTNDEVLTEGARFCQRQRLTPPGRFDEWLKANGLNGTDFHRLMFQNARISKLHRALTGTQLVCRKTQCVLDYLRTHGKFEPWALKSKEGQKVEDEGHPVDLSGSPMADWIRNSERLGIVPDGSFEDFLREYGFYCGAEFHVEHGRQPLGTPI